LFLLCRFGGLKLRCDIALPFYSGEKPILIFSAVLKRPNLRTVGNINQFEKIAIFVIALEIFLPKPPRRFISLPACSGAIQRPYI
jgi:hypothetical protein